MKKSLFLIFVISIFVFSCVGIPKKDYERVSNLRERVNKYDKLKDYSKNEYDKAEQEYALAKAIVEDETRKKEGKEAKISLLSAETNYKVVVAKMPDYATDLQKDTDDEIAKADSLKASVDFAEKYNNARAYYDSAKASIEKNNYDKALDDLLLAKTEYSEVYAMAKDKYDESNTLLTDVKNKLSELEKMQKELASFKGK